MARARLWISEDYGAHWQSRPAPLRQGVESAGVFSIAGGGVGGTGEWLAVGGDYRADKERREVAFATRDRGAGFRSAVEALPAALGGGWITTGTAGTDLSAATASGFRFLSVEGFHAVRAAKRGDLVVLVGAGGRLARLAPGGSPN